MVQVECNTHTLSLFLSLSLSVCVCVCSLNAVNCTLSCIMFFFPLLQSFAVDILKSKLDLALKMGATDTILSSDANWQTKSKTFFFF